MYGFLIRRLASTAIALLLIGAMVVSTAEGAEASNFGATAASDCGYYWGVSDDSLMSNCVSTANNSYHAVRFYSLGNQWPGIDTATTWALSNVYNPTDLVAYVTTTDNLPDVRVWDYYYGAIGILGWVDCPADNTGVGYKIPSEPTTRWCRGQILRFNGSYYDTYSSTSDARALACHELGHTVGLRHRSGDCMETPIYPGSHPTSLDTHSVAHINQYYP